jgi:hypothetical protein
VLAFLDTEFTDLVVQPRLLSVGLVTDRADGAEFYAEVTDADRIGATGWFGLGAVLPQFGKVDKAPCRYADLGLRLATFLATLAASLPPGEMIDLAHGHHLDWDLVDRALGDTGAAPWAATRLRVRPVNVYAFTGYDTGHVAAEAYFKAQAQATLSRHHALCDARALRVAYEAATLEAVRPGTMAPVLPWTRRALAA